MSQTIFDKIIRQEIPAEIVYEDEHVLSFKDINPQAAVHVLVIPKVKVQKFTVLIDQPALEVGEFFKGVARVASQLGLAENGYRVILNCGKYGCQTVDYLHAHIMGSQQLQGWDT